MKQQFFKIRLKPYRIIKGSLVFLLVCLGAMPAQAGSLEDALEHYQLLSTEYQELKSQYGALISRAAEPSGKSLMRLSRKEKKAVSRATQIRKLLKFWKPAAGLQEALLASYKKVHPQASFLSESPLRVEANRLAIELTRETERLQRQIYKIHSFPVIHNFLIMMHYKKRGACKHWAEDLLKKIEGLPRQYFIAHWGEAYPGKVLEHNVAVLVPQGGHFDDGLMVDPWRTGGEMFWLPVTQDKMYHWNSWKDYKPR